MSVSKIHELGTVKLHWLLHLGNKRNLVTDGEADKAKGKILVYISHCYSQEVLKGSLKYK